MQNNKIALDSVMENISPVLRRSLRRRSSMPESDSRLPLRIPPPLCNQKSWSTDNLRDEAWSNRRRNNRLRRGNSITDDDLNELRACFELGFKFDSPDLDPKLSSTFPALEFYYAVNKQYSDTLSRSSSASFSDCDSASSSLESNSSIIVPSEDPGMVKTKLKQWAQVVACSVRQISPNLRSDDSSIFGEEKSKIENK